MASKDFCDRKNDKKCCYCGAMLSDNNRHNADPWTLSFRRQFPKGAKCCNACNENIVMRERRTQTKRAISKIEMRCR